MPARLCNTHRQAQVLQGCPQTKYCFDLILKVEYALMVERAGASVLAVHGRTREQKDLEATRADWSQIRAVKQVRTDFFCVFITGLY